MQIQNLKFEISNWDIRLPHSAITEHTFLVLQIHICSVSNDDR